MTRILFYSRKAYSYFTPRKASDMQIIDYFDIEVQKIIHFIGYRLKKNPVIVNDIISSDYTRCFDLDAFMWATYNDIDTKTISIIFECV